MTNDLPNEASMPAWAEGLDFEGWKHRTLLMASFQRRHSSGMLLRVKCDGELLLISARVREPFPIPCKTPAAALEVANQIALATGGWA